MRTMGEDPKDALVDALDAQINAGDAGTIEFPTAGGVEVATATPTNPAHGAASGGAMALAAVTEDADATGGIMTKAACKENGGTGKVIHPIVLTRGPSGKTVNMIRPHGHQHRMEAQQQRRLRAVWAITSRGFFTKK